MLKKQNKMLTDTEDNVKALKQKVNSLEDVITFKTLSIEVNNCIIVKSIIS